MLTAALVSVTCSDEYISAGACVDFFDVVTDFASPVVAAVAVCVVAAPAVALVPVAAVVVSAPVLCGLKVLVFFLQMHVVGAIFAVQML